ncbi:hypothetical protein LTR42_009212 [Elasticomyces elasticus]|nr:hypothetical protein LTR42_009212 [Elasticomyces elasticus]
MDRLYREAADRRARSGAPSPSSYHPRSTPYGDPLHRSYTSRESSSRGLGGEYDALARAQADIRGRYPSVSRDRAPSQSYEFRSYRDDYGRRTAMSRYPLDGANPPMPSRSGRQMPLSYETRYGERSGTYGARSTLGESLLTRGFPGGPPQAARELPSYEREPRYESRGRSHTPFLGGPALPSRYAPSYEPSYESSSYPKKSVKQRKTPERLASLPLKSDRVC